MVQYYRAVLLGEGNQIITWVEPGYYGCSEKFVEHAMRGSKFVAAVELMLTSNCAYTKSRVVWAGDYADDEASEGRNIFKMCNEEKRMVPEESNMAYYRYLVNHTKKQVVDKERCDKYTNCHPLPFLTAEGSGRGGGDYAGEHAIIGSWARDSISVEKICPKGYIEIIFDLPG